MVNFNETFNQTMHSTIFLNIARCNIEKENSRGIGVNVCLRTCSKCELPRTLIWLPAGMNHMSHQAWRMPATLTGNHTARHSQQHAHPGSPCSSKPDCPVAKGDARIHSSIPFVCQRIPHVFFFSCGILTFGAISPRLWPSFWLQIMLLIVFGILCALMALKPHAESHAGYFWCFLHPLSVFHHKLV